MNKLKLFFVISLIIFGVSVLFISSTSVQASILDNIKDFFNQGEDKNVKNKEFTVESSIELAPDGDDNKNNEIDAGDIIRFTYTITNTTDQAYSYATLKTNIDRKQLNFIHNVQGTSGITDDGETVTIPNVRLEPLQTLVVSFDARINYYQDEDKTIITEAEFVDDKKNSIAKSSIKQIKAKKINVEKIKSTLNRKESNQ